MTTEKTTPTLSQRFWRFHTANPHVYAELLQLTRTAKAAGFDHIGIKMLWEVCRWHLQLATTGEPFVLNNSFTPFYARLIMALNPELNGMFELRRQRCGNRLYPAAVNDNRREVVDQAA